MDNESLKGANLKVIYKNFVEGGTKPIGPNQNQMVKAVKHPERSAVAKPDFTTMWRRVQMDDE